MSLTIEEVCEAVSLAHGRNKKLAAGIPSRKYDKSRSDIEIDILGMIAEMTVAKELGLEVDKGVWLHGDGGKNDLRVGDLSIAIKSSPHKTAHLYFNTLNHFKDDIAVLVVASGDVTKPRVCGWITKLEFSGICEELNFGYGSRVGITQDKLRPIEELKAFIRWLK